MTTNEIVKTYHITRQTLYNWINEDKALTPSGKFGKQNTWNKKQIEIIEKKSRKKYKKKQTDPLYIKNRRYLGSKQKLLDFINDVVSSNTNNVNSIADIFGGTGVVSDMFNNQGKRIIINDLLTSNYISYLAWFGNEEINKKKIAAKISELNNLKGISDYVTKYFGNKYFSLENAQKIDAIREKIETYSDLNYREKAILLTSLLYAMDRVANTVGHYDAFRQKMDSLDPIVLKIPVFNTNINNEIYQEDANSLVRKIQADLVYIDPPYNSRGYENTYHVLENIIEWKKPAVQGVAAKAINRKEKTSIYTKAKAPQAFDDLIKNINAKYILVSYNNMAKKGNSRSNAKISNEEILSCLKKRGEVKVFETEFSAYTTGKSKIDNHKEILYLCIINKKKKNNIIESPLNYTGGKQKLFSQLQPLFPTQYKRFIDLFAGGGSVTANLIKTSTAKQFIVNDIEKHVMGFFDFLSKTDIEKFIKQIENYISYYGLSNTKKYGYEYYHCNSANGLGVYNKAGFLKLREDYNNSPSPTLFYLLIVFGFNNQIRYNSSGKYNLPVGKRDFNKKMENKLREFYKIINDERIKFSVSDFRQIDVNDGDFIYADPPYILSTATYNENKGWTLQDEIDLYSFLDKAHEKGAKFALSNVIKHKGRENKILKDWSSKYKLNVLNYNYNNSNYQSNAKNSETIEVLVTNY